jgi:16S rRNA C967 or C1407 C5-methylase (RsmB/RsmF family)/NOL1/NOP2/fmu family ribosome biogenesis protein
MSKANRRTSGEPEGNPLPDDVLPADQWPLLQEALLRRPRKAVRPRPTQALGDGVALPLPFAFEPVPWYPHGVFCLHETRPGGFLQHAAGMYFVQDAGSMLALQLLAAEPHEVIADVCAAPGAKASALLEVVGPGGGFLLANEPIRGRVSALRGNLARVGFPAFGTSTLDVDRLAEAAADCCDAVLVDVPCSGQALVGRGKQSRRAFSAQQVKHAAARQRRILAAAARLVRPGGRLVYSTCTFAVEENEDVIAEFLARHYEWDVEPQPELAAWETPREPGGYRIYPHREGSAGAFAVRLRRKCSSAAQRADTSASASGPPVRQPAESGDAPFVLHDEPLGQWCGNFELQQTSSSIQLLPAALPTALRKLPITGLEIAYRPRKQWMPAHGLALQRAAGWQPHATLTLDDQLACRFLMGEPLPAGVRGWTVVRWRGHPLGWVRGTELRANNGLPASARISAVPRLASDRHA